MGLTRISKEMISPEFIQEVDGLTTQLAEIVQDRAKPTIIQKMINGDTVSIVCYGDSLTYGWLPGDLQSSLPYPLALQNILRSYYNNNNITVFNEGISGNQSDDLALQSNIDKVKAHNPDLTILMVGVNDNHISPVISIDNYMTNVESIIKKVGSKFLLMSPTIGFRAGVDGEFKSKSRLVEYGKAMKKVADKNNCDFLDTFQLSSNLFRYEKDIWSNVLPDDLHFADGYYQKFAEWIFANGICSDNIVVSEDANLHIHDVAWKFKNTYSYVKDTKNPPGVQVTLTPTGEANISFFINMSSAKVYLLTNSGSSKGVEFGNVAFTVDGVAKTIPFSNRQATAIATTFYNERFFVGEFEYGLHTVTIKNNDAVNWVYINSLMIEESKKKRVYSNLSITGVTSPKVLTDSPFTYSTPISGTDIISFKEIGNFGETIVGKKYRITLNPKSNRVGIALGSHYIANGSTIYKAPKYAFLGNTTALENYIVRFPTATTYSTAKILTDGTVTFTLNQDNTIDFEFTADSIIITVNGSISKTIPYTDMIINSFDVWATGYYLNSSVTISKIEELA